MPHHSLCDLALLTCKCHLALGIANFQGFAWRLAYKCSIHVYLLNK